MNAAIRLFAIFVRDLLGKNEQLIRIGRQNFERSDFEAANIVIDIVGPFSTRSIVETYDGTEEELSLGSVHSALVTMDFYGDDAFADAVTFSHLSRSQTALDLLAGTGLTIQIPSRATDLKNITGQQYGERVQLEVNVYYSTQTVIDNLRIDTAVLEISDESGVIHSD